MIFFLNLDGTCTRQDTDHVYQGSNNVSKVVAVTSISPAQTFVQVAFTLPNSLTYGYLPMAYKGAYQVGSNVNNLMHLWEFSLPYNVTEMKGTVGVSFNVVNSNTGANLTSYTSTFEVEYSALPIPPSSASESELEQILNLLNAYYAQNTGIIADHTSQIQAIQTEQTTQNNAISALQAQSTSLQQSVTKNASDIAEIKTEQTAQNSAISALQSYVLTGENYVGTLPSSATMPTDEQIQQYYAQNVGRSPRVSDVLFFTLTATSGYKVFKYIYTVTGWAYYEIPGANVGSNPNLVINPNFAINQRGQTTYTPSTSGKHYTVDRWCTNYNQFPVIIGNGYVETANNLMQYYEDYSSFANLTVTVSMKVKPLTAGTANRARIAIIKWVNGVYTLQESAYSDGTTNEQIVSFTTTLPDMSNITQFAIRIYNSSEDGSIVHRYYWVKIEVGSVATAFTPPNIAEELAKCQRYYYRIQPNRTFGFLGGGGVFRSATEAFIPITFPTTMYKTPTFGYGGNSFALVGISTYQISSFTTSSNSRDGLFLRAVTSGATAGQACVFYTGSENDGSYVDFDAEI